MKKGREGSWWSETEKGKGCYLEENDEVDVKIN